MVGHVERIDEQRRARTVLMVKEISVVDKKSDWINGVKISRGKTVGARRHSIKVRKE